MPVASLPEVMDRAFTKRYGVAAFNTVDDITMHGVIRAAEQSRSPLIVQISVKTVKFWGAEVVQHMFTDMAGRAKVPVALHLDQLPADGRLVAQLSFCLHHELLRDPHRPADRRQRQREKSGQEAHRVTACPLAPARRSCAAGVGPRT